MSHLGSFCARSFVLGSCCLALMTGCSAPSEDTSRSSERVIYGADDRIEPSQAAPSSLAASLTATEVALFFASDLDVSDPTNVRPLGPTLQQRNGLCADERFASQPTSANCSGTLLAPDLVLTAGHCVDQTTCSSTRIVLGYLMATPQELAPITSAQVFSCSSIAAWELGPALDYAVVRLDRPTAVSSFPKPKVGELPLGSDRSLLLAGNPSGLPLKLDGGGVVRDGRAATRDFFLADLDSFPGNSGSGVFVQDTGELAGILVRGPNPGYEPRPGETCRRVQNLDPTKDQLIESVYVHHAIQAYCAGTNDPRLCTCGDRTCDAAGGENSATCDADCGSLCGDGECNGSEDGTSCYADCGRCGNSVCEPSEVQHMSCSQDCGCPPGMVPDHGSCSPSKGNTNGDGVVDAQDVSALQSALRQPLLKLVNRDAADVDCNDKVDTRDLDALGHFLDGSAARLPCQAVSNVALGAQHSCVLSPAGKVRCFGENAMGQLGLGNTARIGDDELPGAAPFVKLSAPAAQITAGGAHTCALLSGGKVQCWGDGSDGMLGHANTRSIGDDESPADQGPLELGAPATAVVAGATHTCAILQGGDVRCWGSNFSGQLGYGTPDTIGDDETPASVAPLHFAAPVTQLALGFDHSCARTSDGNVYCWGGNLFGQIGRGNPIAGGPFERGDATEPLALGGPVASISAGNFDSCAVRTDGTAFCWGENLFGQLGNGTFDSIGDDETPSVAGPVPTGPGLQELAVGLERICARYVGGAVKCWGLNFNGQLGYGNSFPLPPFATPDTLDAVNVGGATERIFAGAGQTCALLAGGTLRCWGDNEAGQLGYGNTLPVGADNVPAAVGDVSFAQPTTPGWHFVNPAQLEVWTTSQTLNARGSRVGLFVVNRGRNAVSGLRALYDFQLGASETAMPVLHDLLTPWSQPQLSATTPALGTLLFDFGTRELSAGRVSSLGLLGGENVTLTAPEASAAWQWDAQNDYAAADRHSVLEWQRTERVQLLDASGALIYGWAR